jgi:hypothetical protein
MIPVFHQESSPIKQAPPSRVSRHGVVVDSQTGRVRDGHHSIPVEFPASCGDLVYVGRSGLVPRF